MNSVGKTHFLGVTAGCTCSANAS